MNNKIILKGREHFKSALYLLKLFHYSKSREQFKSALYLLKLFNYTYLSFYFIAYSESKIIITTDITIKNINNHVQKSAF